MYLLNNAAMCFGKTTCLNGGRCVAPNTCSCNAGYSKPRCEGNISDINGYSKTRLDVKLISL